MDPEQIEKDTKMMVGTTKKLNFQLKGQTDALKLTNEMEKDIAAFRIQIPIIRVFCNEGLEARHWEQIKLIVGADINPETKKNLKFLMDMEVIKHQGKLEEISNVATNEFNMRKILDKMDAEWDQITAEIKV